MDLMIPTCNHSDCSLVLQTRDAMARRGDRTVAYEARVWRCERCPDPDAGEPPLEFLDAQLIAANDAALATAWRARYGEEVPSAGRPGRKTLARRTERVAVLLTSDELAHVDRRRGLRSRSEFLRAVIGESLRQPGT